MRLWRRSYRSFSVRRVGVIARLLLLGSTLSVAHGEQMFVSILEADSLESINYGAVGFSRTADLPLVREQVEAWLNGSVLVPKLAGIAPNELLRIVLTVDPGKPIDKNNPASVALLKVIDDGTTARQELAAAYQRQRDERDFAIYEEPHDTNMVARVAVATTGHWLITSESVEALGWVWENRQRLIGAPRQTLPGTFRVLVNPQHFADLYGARIEVLLPLFKFGEFLREFETLTLSFTLSGLYAGVTISGTPLKETALAALVDSWQLPEESFWSAVADQPYFVSLGSYADGAQWQPFLVENSFEIFKPFVEGVDPGVRVTQIVATRDNKGLCLVQQSRVKSGEAATARMRALADNQSESATFKLKHGRSRQVGGSTIEVYEFEQQKFSTDIENSTSLLQALLMLVIRNAVLEVTVVNDWQVIMLGPQGALDELLPPRDYQARHLTLNRVIGNQDDALDHDLVFGGKLLSSSLLRQAVTIMPEAKQEQVRRLPLGGDGAFWGIKKRDDTLVASLRIYANEIAALQRINRDGRATLQEIFFTIFTKQLMEMQVPKAD